MKSKNTTLPKLFIGIDMHKANWNVRLATDLFQSERYAFPMDPLLLRDNTYALGCLLKKLLYIGAYVTCKLFH